MFILYFLVLLISILAIETYITGVVRTHYINDQIESLSHQARLIAERIPFPFPESLDDFCKHAKSTIKARITIINADGGVIGDSDTPSSMMENHAARPEVKSAAVSGTGTAVRFSQTVRKELLYFAFRIEKNDAVKGFIRLAVPLQEVNRAINVLRLKINLVVILIFLVAGSLLFLQTNRIRKLIQVISDYAGALAHGLFKKRLHIEKAGEFSELASNLNDMASELEESMREKDEKAKRLNVILKSIPDAFLLIGMDGMIELSNTVARDLFKNSHLEGKPFIEIVRSTDFLSLVERVKRDRMPGSADISIDLPQEKYLSVRVSPLSYTVGELAGFVAIFHDTTHLKKLEQMRRDFVANVSHEIKTPVTAIKGFAETLIDGALLDTKNAEKFLGTIKSHSERLDRLVDDLLTISGIELGALKVQKTDVIIADVIQNVMQMMIVKAAEKDLEIKESVEDEKTVIHAERDRLEQVLLNLVDNAIKFTDRGEIEIGISHERGRNFFYVRDTGIGVPVQYIERLGERFFRVDASRSRELGGTGLGLAIVKHIVKAHGWEMKVESRVGEGTTVRIYY
jgi:two-component system phosphate regulon sensor histidine kinase PhoR